MTTDIQSAADLLAACEGTLVRDIEFHREHPSTNDRALALAGSATESQLPLLVLADEQTAGRGRGSNVWWATRGALTFSLLVNPAKLGIPTERWGTTSLATAMAVARTLLEFAPESEVAWKWPNDVYVGNRKICGILLEVPSMSPPRMVIGVGLNGNNEMDAESSGDLCSNAISLATIMGQPCSLSQVLNRFLTSFADVVSELQKDPLHLSRLWAERDYLMSRSIELQVGTRTIKGIALGIGSDGAIRVECAGGIQTFPGGILTKIGDHES